LKPKGNRSVIGLTAPCSFRSISSNWALEPGPKSKIDVDRKGDGKTGEDRACRRKTLVEFDKGLQRGGGKTISRDRKLEAIFKPRKEGKKIKRGGTRKKRKRQKSPKKAAKKGKSVWSSALGWNRHTLRTAPEKNNR